MDSHLAPAALDELDRAQLLEHVNNRWGMIPGEAAAGCLLLPDADHSGELAVVLQAASVADARKPTDPRDGRALTDATRTVLSALPAGERIAAVYANLNGIRERVDDVGFTLARIAGKLQTLPCMTTPADRFGDVGAAFVPLSAVLAVSAARWGASTGPNVLICCEGPGASSGAVLLSIPVSARTR